MTSTGPKYEYRDDDKSRTTRKHFYITHLFPHYLRRNPFSFADDKSAAESCRKAHKTQNFSTDLRKRPRLPTADGWWKE